MYILICIRVYRSRIVYIHIVRVIQLVYVSSVCISTLIESLKVYYKYIIKVYVIVVRLHYKFTLKKEAVCLEY